MSKKLEKVLECLLNEEHDSAEELLHDFVVEKARQCYQDLVNEEDMDMDDESIHNSSNEDENIEEDIGGDMADDFANEIEATGDDMEMDDDMEMGDDMEMDDDMEMGDEVEDRVEDLESALADLRAEFDALMNGDDDMEMDDDDMEMDDEKIEEYGSLEEATKLQDKVSDPSNAEGAENTKSMYSQSPDKTNTAGKPVDFVSSEENSQKESEGKDNTPSSNVNTKHGSAPTPEKSEKADGTDTLLTKQVK
jgi:hypothetical protein